MSGGGGGDGGLGDSVEDDQEDNPTGHGQGSWKVPRRRCAIPTGLVKTLLDIFFSQGFQIYPKMIFWPAKFQAEKAKEKGEGQ